MPLKALRQSSGNALVVPHLDADLSSVALRLLYTLFLIWKGSQLQN